MTALNKPKQYDWKDSNLALFGSDLERQVKKESSQSEIAWRTAGKHVGLQIWRIVNFKVTTWPKEDYGKFFEGDSYIVLNTYEENEKNQLLYDVHFWIGKYSTQTRLSIRSSGVTFFCQNILKSPPTLGKDEYGTAAYKTVELDTYLDDVPTQHREVQGYESDLFKSYFKTIEILKGGAASGFKNVKPVDYKPRLLHFHGDRNQVFVKEVSRSLKVLDKTDVYILDLGLKLLLWNGSGSNKDERFKAQRYMQGIVDERNGKPKAEVLDEGSADEEFISHLNEQKEEEEYVYICHNPIKELFRLSDASGQLQFFLEKSDLIKIKDFDSKDVFVLDIKTEVFVWIGKDTSPAERKNALIYAHMYLQKTDHPFVPVSCIKEGTTFEAFEIAVAS